MKNRLREVMRAQGLSTAELSEKSWVPTQLINLIKLDGYEPSKGAQQRIANALGVHINELFYEDTNN